MTGPACRDIRQALGVYLVGAIDPAERSAVDIHLATCPDCREELAGLAGLPALLGRVAARRAARRWRVIAAAAAAVVIAVAGGAVGARLLAPGGQAAVPQYHVSTAAEVVRATNPRTHVSAVIRYSATSWGTKMDVRVTGIPYGTSCQMWVVSSGGQRLPAGGWKVAYSQQDAQYPASVSVASSGLRSFEITSHGRVLVTVPAA